MHYLGSDYNFAEGVSFLSAPSYGIANKMARMIRDYTLTAKEIEQIASLEEKKQRKYLKKQVFVPVALCVAFQKLFRQG